MPWILKAVNNFCLYSGSWECLHRKPCLGESLELSTLPRPLFLRRRSDCRWPFRCRKTDCRWPVAADETDCRPPRRILRPVNSDSSLRTDKKRKTQHFAVRRARRDKNTRKTRVQRHSAERELKSAKIPAARAGPRNRPVPSLVVHGAADTRPKGALEHFWRWVGPGPQTGARTRTRADETVRPRPLVTFYTGNTSKYRTPVKRKIAFSIRFHFAWSCVPNTKTCR